MSVCSNSNTDDSNSDVESFDFLGVGGEMSQRTRSFDWSTTSLGPVETWPQSLTIAVRIMLGSRYAMWLGWGPDFTFFYNDAYARMTLGPKHPWALGRSAREVWSEIWTDIGPRAESVISTGQATWDEGLLLYLERRGFSEETYHTFSYSPLPDDRGHIGGMLCVVTEDTERTIGERRLKTLRELAARTNVVVQSVDLAIVSAIQVLSGNAFDLPFVAVYLLDADGHQANLAGQTGLNLQAALCPDVVDLHQTPWPFRQVASEGKAILVEDLENLAPAHPVASASTPASRAMVLALMKPGQSQPAGFVIAGISPRLLLSDEYRGFLDLLAGQLATAISNARAYEEERLRAEALAELDRAKTTFFSNVSHEFRTPLTLLLGPVDDILAEMNGDLRPHHRERLEIAQRNGLRLQKLVNTLLDFARIEAGRTQATFEPTDLATYTSDLASNFRSACERAGLELKVDCQPVAEPVFVDRQMWEKIILNLLSNAFKFTFEGEIRVSLRQIDRNVEVRVADTGVGVPVEEVPRLFERFYRVENSRGRTHEGSGIGLALVHELVKQHNGSITIESELGQGTSFIISIPLGSQGLSKSQVAQSGTKSLPNTAASAYVEEALRWLPDAVDDDDGAPPAAVDSKTQVTSKSESPMARSADRRVLVVDDNADMRRYITTLLAQDYLVETASDGLMALDVIRRQPPDLILSDVMMPRLDGFGLLQKLRGDPATAAIPIILLSARSGEESRVEGMSAGADDYLVKPFGARELAARVSAHLQMAQLRRDANDTLKQSEEKFRVLFETMTEGFIVVEVILDPSGRPADLLLSEMNPAFEKHTGLNRADIINRTLVELFPDAEPIWLNTMGQVALTGLPAHFRSEFGPVGRWFEVSSYRTAENRVATVFFDITDKKRAEEVLQEADRRKDEFLATLAHELRNPLAPVRNAVQVLHMKGPGAPELVWARDIIDRQVQVMTRLIDDLMDVSRISSGKMELNRERVEIARIVQGAVETSRPLINQQGHQLTVSMPSEPIYVDADLTRLSQVVLNLLNNAAKYTEPEGRIELTVERQDGSVLLTVRDTGIGIPTDKLPTLFNMFSQIEGSLARSQGGLGIGLYLVKRLVEMHGGSIKAASDGLACGSKFVVQLPTIEHEQQPASKVASQSTPASKLSILVVDDNVDAAMTVSMLLNLMGNTVRTAHDGADALEVAAEFRPQVALLDIGLPKLSGYDVARTIRQQAWGKQMTLIAVTGWGQAEDRRKSHDAGFNHHLVKPVDPQALMQILADIENRLK